MTGILIILGVILVVRFGIRRLSEESRKLDRTLDGTRNNGGAPR